MPVPTPSNGRGGQLARAHSGRRRARLLSALSVAAGAVAVALAARAAAGAFAGHTALRLRPAALEGPFGRAPGSGSGTSLAVHSGSSVVGSDQPPEASSSAPGDHDVSFNAIGGRRATVAVASALAVLGSGVDVEAASGADEPKVTMRCAFDIQIGFNRSSPLRRLVIGLYGEEAPILTRNFYQAFTRTYPKDVEGMVDYQYADVKAIYKDRAIVWADFQFGNVNRRQYTKNKGGIPIDRIEDIPLAQEDTATNETNNLRHDRLGRVSMRRGGETFDFTVAPVAPAPWLDETNVVIGQVLEGFDIIEEINKIPVKGGALFEDSFGLLGQSDVRWQLAQKIKLKPLKRVRIYEKELLP